jgi:AcrR family transcriptional regulator
MPNLIERRHEQTRAAIADAAIGLFTRQGFAATTMEQVADAAGVSRRTAYRHFPSKDDLVFEQPRRWLVHFDEVLDEPVPDESPREQCRRGLLAVAQLIEANAASIIPAFNVMLATPSLRGYNGRTEDAWFERYVELLGTGADITPARAVEVATVAGSLVGTTKALVGVWAATHPAADMEQLTRAALDQLDPIWPDWLRSCPG